MMRPTILFSTLVAVWGSAFAAVPVTGQPPDDDEGTFRFAILADRNGGMRPGVFEDAVDKVNCLQPDFVLSVGDLIDGYTQEPGVWNEQWEEFEAIVNRLGMPFYFVPGNHDISNGELLSAWKERRGDPYYCFVHENVLFLILHTEDLSGGGIGPEQIRFAVEALAAHPDVRWTLLFFHRPLWLYEDQAGYGPIEEALAGRSYTVFTGHHHNYLKAERHGMTHYVLATTGGGSALRGPEFGEFDHVTWVTMKPDGPVVTLLALDGILSDGIVDETTRGPVDSLREGLWMRVDPVLHEDEAFDRLPLVIHLSNPQAYPLEVSGHLAAPSGLRFEPEDVAIQVPPAGWLDFKVDLLAVPAIPIHDLNEAGLELELTGAYAIGERRLTLPARKRVLLDWVGSVEMITGAIRIDGDLSDWKGQDFTEVSHPSFIYEDWDWHGPEDGRFRFAVARDADRLLIAVQTFDDRVLVSARRGVLQDRLYLDIETASGRIRIEGVAGTEEADIAVRATAGGLVGEFAFPLPVGEEMIRLNVGWMDHDRPENTKPSVLWWRDLSVPGFGSLRVDQK
ncbi:MAG: metallophosphoesterase [Opitutaceae bacterium]